MIKKLKRRVYLWLSGKNGNSKILQGMQLANQILFHWNDRLHMAHPGKEDPDKTYYVIRPASKSEGLLSLYFNRGIEGVLWGQQQGYIPYINYATADCQYHVARKVNGTENAWEYYFKQPISITPEELKQKKNVLMSGWSLKKIPSVKLTPEYVRSPAMKKMCQDTCAVQPYILAMAKNIAAEKMVPGKTLGVFLRGTDYVALKPKGHYRQPTAEQVMEKVDEFRGKYDLQKILVVTEDFEIFEKFKKKYGERVFSNDDNFVKNYSASDYIENAFQDDPYERGLKYLVRLLLLTECDYLISSITNGSLFVLAEKQDAYVDEYLFDLGRYE